MAFCPFFFLYVQLGLFKHLAFYRSNLSLPLITFARVCFCSLLNCLDGVPRTFYHHLYTLVPQLIRWCFLSRWLMTLSTDAAPSVSGSSILLSLWNTWSLAEALFLPAGVPPRMFCCLSSWLCIHLDFFTRTISQDSFFPFLWKEKKCAFHYIFFLTGSNASSILRFKRQISCWTEKKKCVAGCRTPLKFSSQTIKIIINILAEVVLEI